MSGNNIQVIVGNIGQVFNGDSLNHATDSFNEYKWNSKHNYGKAAGEIVTMLIDGEIEKEYFPE